MNRQAGTASPPPATPRRAGIAVIAMVLAGLAMPGCSGGNPVSKPTMNQQHATALAQQILRETADVITPRPTLEIYHPTSGTGPCLITPSDKRVQVTLTYFLRGIPVSDNASVAQQILRYWKHKGYAITDTHGLGTGSPSIFGATPSDDFLINLATSNNGAMSIEATSPCIWPKGTPPAS